MQKKTHLNRVSFRKQLLSIFAMSVMGLAIVLAAVSSWLVSTQMREQIINQSIQVTTNLASQSVLALLYESKDILEEPMTAALNYPAVTYVRILNSDFKNFSSKGGAIKGSFAVLPKIYTNDKAYMVSETADVWHFVAPIFNFTYVDDEDNKELIGLVYVIVDKGALIKIQTSIFITNISIAIMVTMIILLILNFILMQVVKPLNNLSQTMRMASKGETKVKADLMGPTEVVEIADVFNSMIEVLEERQSALYKEKEHTMITLESIADGVITTDTKGKVLYLNPVAERLTGWKKEEIKDNELDDIFKVFDETNHRKEDNPILTCLIYQKVITSQQFCMYRPKIGNEIFVEISVSLTRDINNYITGTVMIFHDVTEKRDMAKKLNYQATHDSLTGLFNRADFERHLESVLESVESNDEHALCYMDLDQFKIINDTCGHMAGDQLLQNISELLSNKVRKTGDLLARVGGDEFVLLLENCPLHKAEEIAKAMCETVQEYRYVWDDKPFTIGVSIGVVAINNDDRDLQSVLSKADRACYMAKEKGRNRVHTYLVDDQELMQRQGEMNIVSNITEAYENDLFQLYYQPIVSVNNIDEKTQHYEILIRMFDKDGNILPPGFFLPAAERYNLAHKIDHWVIRTALNWLAQNPVHLGNLKCCAINLSGMSLNDEKLFDFIELQFKKTGVPREKICFEITETAAITNLSRATDLIRKLRNLGCKTALDDFGSGMSSFAYLKHFPIDYLKIDGVFVKDIMSDPIDNAMVKSVNDIGHVLGLTTIAEYVEDEAILARLKELGIDEAQGYYIAKPRPLNMLSDTNAKNKKAIQSV